ncbi:hypothetical protein ACH3XW_26995 [Acanthocheilonema viteae]
MDKPIVEIVSTPTSAAFHSTCVQRSLYLFYRRARPARRTTTQTRQLSDGTRRVVLRGAAYVNSLKVWRLGPFVTW